MVCLIRVVHQTVLKVKKKQASKSTKAPQKGVWNVTGQLIPQIEGNRKFAEYESLAPNIDSDWWTEMQWGATVTVVSALSVICFQVWPLGAPTSGFCGGAWTDD